MVPPPPTSSPTSVHWPSGDFQYHGHNSRFSFIKLRGVARSNQELPGIGLRLRLGLVCKPTNPHTKLQTPVNCYFHSNNDCAARTCCSRGIRKCHYGDTGSSNRRCHRCSGSERHITIPEFQLYRVCRFTSDASNRNPACSQQLSDDSRHCHLHLHWSRRRAPSSEGRTPKSRGRRRVARHWFVGKVFYSVRGQSR